MKYLVVLICIVMPCACFAQDAKLVTGKWQAVVMSNNERFYDLENDSFVVNKDYLLTAVMDSTKLDSSIRMEKRMMKKLITANRLQFNADGSYTVWYGAWGAATGHYVVDEKQQVITFLQDGGEKVKDKMKYRFYKNRLEIKLGEIDEVDRVVTISSPINKNAENELTIVYKKVNQF